MNQHSVQFYRNRAGLYNLTIKDERGSIVVDVQNVQLPKIIELIRKHFDGGNT